MTGARQQLVCSFSSSATPWLSLGSSSTITSCFFHGLLSTSLVSLISNVVFHYFVCSGIICMAAVSIMKLFNNHISMFFFLITACMIFSILWVLINHLRVSIKDSSRGENSRNDDTSNENGREDQNVQDKFLEVTEIE